MSRLAPDSLVPAVDRAARMLACFRHSGDQWRISDLARELKIPKSSAFQIASTLCHHRMLARNDETRRYRLGPRLVQIASRAGYRTDISVLAQPYLEELAGLAQATALLGLFTGEATVLAGKAEAPEPLGISAPTGLRLYHSAGAFGKLYHASLDATELNALLASQPLRRFTANTIVRKRDYRRELEEIRRQGYALDNEEYLVGVSALAAPVWDRAGAASAAICMVGLSASFGLLKEATVVAAVTRTAAELSRELGCKGESGWRLDPGGDGDNGAHR